PPRPHVPHPFPTRRSPDLHGVDFAPDGTRVYISNEADSTLDVVDRKTGKIVKKVRLSGHPNNIAVTRDGDRVIICIAEDKGGLEDRKSTRLNSSHGSISHA